MHTETSYACTHANTHFLAKLNCFHIFFLGCYCLCFLPIWVTHDVDQENVRVCLNTRVCPQKGESLDRGQYESQETTQYKNMYCKVTDMNQTDQSHGRQHKTQDILSLLK